MKALLLITVSFLTCAISLPNKFIKREWPTISLEPAENPGGFVHQMNSYWVTTVRYNANFYAKWFAATTLLSIITITVLSTCLALAQQ